MKWLNKTWKYFGVQMITKLINFDVFKLTNLVLKVWKDVWILL